MSLPTWNKMALNIKLSAKKRYELLRSEINGIDIPDNSSDIGTLQGDVSSLKERVGALETALETNHPSQQNNDPPSGGG